MAKAHVEQYHGETAMMANGEPLPPMSETVRSGNLQYPGESRLCAAGETKI